MVISLKKCWNKISTSYQKEFFVKIENGEIDREMMVFLGDVKGKKIIELGCGAGQDSIIFAEKGAIVTAIDFSEEQIKYGKELAKKHKADVNFVVADLNELDKHFSEEEFDIAYSSYAFQYIENLDKLFHNVNKILGKNGVFTFSLDHPFLASGDWINLKSKEYFVVNNYFKRGKKFFIWKFKNGVHVKCYTYRRTLQDFFDNLTKNHFLVEKIVEPEPLKPYRNLPKGYEYSKMKRVPYTIIFKAKKL